MRPQHTLLAILYLVALPVVHADWVPNTNDPEQVKAKAALEQLLEKRTEAQEFFDRAYGYAVFPSVKRFGAVFGFAWGGGIVIQDDQHLGTCSQFVVDLGPQLGGQVYSQVIFFKDAQALETFQEGRFEFQGRASGVFFGWGGASEPSYLPDVAIFTNIRPGSHYRFNISGSRWHYIQTKQELMYNA
jgi:lipid-binding SYLF domain-containing protein